jgi:hypothetical protein
MDQIRNFTQTNRSSVVNLIYIVAAFVLVYYIVMYYFGSDVKDMVYLKNKMTTSDAKNKIGYYKIAEENAEFRVGPEYTISFWMYITGYKSSTTIQGIMSLMDEGNFGPTGGESLLFIGLHPTKPQMIIRAGDGTAELPNDSTLNWNKVAAPTGAPSEYRWGGSNVNNTAETSALTPCDIMDIDTQRWMNITVSVNGRIMDVYLDGKLARSCIMANAPKTTKMAQIIQLFPTDDYYNGYISGLQVSNYAVTPDVIYGRYQAGPYFSAGFLDYLVDKLGIRINYTGTGKTTESESVLSMFGFNTE